MTRATVGGINSEDNLWYPLAVNSQGIAQIDTSGIPKPLEWKVSTFTPEYGSSDDDAAAIIEYGFNRGYFYSLGEMTFWKLYMYTSGCAITNPRGNLVIKGIPDYTVISGEQPSGSIIYAGNWADTDTVLSGVSRGASSLPYWQISGFKTDGTANVASTIPFTYLNEEQGTKNFIQAQGFFFRNGLTRSWPIHEGILQETGEIPTDTP